MVNGQIRLSNGALLAEAALLAGVYLLRAWSVGELHATRSRASVRRAETDARGRARATGGARTIADVENRTEFRGADRDPAPLRGRSWFYSACQFASLEAREDEAERHTLSGCLALSSEWFGGGLLLFLMMIPLWSAVWLNGLIVALIVPQLLHSIFGLNTLLSTPMGIYALSRSSAFWLSLFAGAWLALDPIVKCSYVVVFQHLRSRREGDDLRGLLASLPREREKKAQMIASTAAGGRVATGALVLLAAILVGTAPMESARAALLAPSNAETAGHTPREAQIQKLQRALDEESRRAIYSWHDAEHPSPPTWFDKLIDKIQQRHRARLECASEFSSQTVAAGPESLTRKRKRWRVAS